MKIYIFAYVTDVSYAIHKWRHKNVLSKKKRVFYLKRPRKRPGRTRDARYVGLMTFGTIVNLIYTFRRPVFRVMIVFNRVAPCFIIHFEMRCADKTDVDLR